MKKIAFLTVILATIHFGTLEAQTEQGNVMVGSSSTFNMIGAGNDFVGIGFSSVKYKSDADGFEEPDPEKSTTFNLSPKVGYFVTNDIAVGLDINMAISSTKGDGDFINKYSQSLLGVGPFVRYYVPLSAPVLPFVEIAGSFGTLKNTYDYSDNTFLEDMESKTSIMSVGGGAGFAAPLGEKVTFDFLLGYNSLTIKDKEDNDDNDRSVFGTFGLKLGFTVFLGLN